MILGILGKCLLKKSTKSLHSSGSPPTMFLSELAKSWIAFLAVRTLDCELHYDVHNISLLFQSAL